MAEPTSDPGQRGKLIVKDRVAERIAYQAAVETAGVVPHASGLDRVTGRDLPRTDVTIAGTHVRAHVEVAVAFPQSLPAVTAAVRDHVATQLTALAGLTVGAVDVSAPTIVPAPTHETRRVQ